MIRKLYNWMLSFGESRWGWAALFLFAMAEASCFPIPPDILLIALCVATPKKSWLHFLSCLSGSIIGAWIGYTIGYFLWMTPSGEYSALANWFFLHIFTEEAFTGMAAYYDEYNFWIVFAAGFTPLPFKLFTITGGLCHINLTMFTIAAIVSRGLRFGLISLLIWKYGEPIRSFIDKYLNLLAIVFTVLLVGSFYIIKYLL